MTGRVRRTDDLSERLREIATLDRATCLARWEDAFGTAPPKYLSIHFMQRVLARECQVRALGDYPAKVRRQARAARSASANAPATRTARPGSFLVREWNGRTYRVEVTPSGYVLDGKTYRSLTTVARRITGTHWSGPRFFGLTGTKGA